MKPCKGRVSEIFSGIQGEGLLVGERQIFIRLIGCNLHCAYCDTPASRSDLQEISVEGTPGRRDFYSRTNPVEVETVLAMVERLDQRRIHHSISITGGEPLMQPEFCADLAAGLKAGGRMVMLETNGTLPDYISAIRPHLDLISMDIKIPTSTHLNDLMEIHRRFLLECQGVPTYAKIVVSSSTTDDEVLAAGRMIGEIAPETTLIIQPVTPVGGVTAPLPEQVLRWQEEAKMLLPRVRVIPQCHKFMDQL